MSYVDMYAVSLLRCYCSCWRTHVRRRAALGVGGGTVCSRHARLSRAVCTAYLGVTGKIAERVDAQWRSELKARGLGKGWLLEKMLSWCESKFGDLLNLEPACLDMYMGDDDNGMTIRRFATASRTLARTLTLALTLTRTRTRTRTQTRILARTLARTRALTLTHARRSLT